MVIAWYELLAHSCASISEAQESVDMNPDMKQRIDGVTPPYTPDTDRALHRWMTRPGRPGSPRCSEPSTNSMPTPG
jgi:hypothetical protein